MNAIIQPDTCSTCAFKFRAPNGALECREGPPSAHPVFAMTPQGPVPQNIVSIFPTVMGDWHCGRHPSIAAKARAGLLAAPALMS